VKVVFYIVTSEPYVAVRISGNILADDYYSVSKLDMTELLITNIES